MLHRRGCQGCFWPVRALRPLHHLDLPSVGQGGSHTDPHSHEDSGQTCGCRGGQCEGLSTESPQPTSPVPLPSP